MWRDLNALKGLYTLAQGLAPVDMGCIMGGHSYIGASPYANLCAPYRGVEGIHIRRGEPLRWDIRPRWGLS